MLDLRASSLDDPEGLTSSVLNDDNPFHYLNLRHGFDAPEITGQRRSSMSRRNLLAGLGAVAVATLAAPSVVRASSMARVGRDRLWIINSGNGETINLPFLFRDPASHRKAWSAYSYFWRDWKDGDQGVWIDRRMLAVLADVQIEISRTMGQETALMLNSGYRTPRRNATIRGAAPGSFHTKGRASDFWSRGLAHRSVQVIASHTSGVGGLGRYADFTHIDTGPSRRWKKGVE